MVSASLLHDVKMIKDKKIRTIVFIWAGFNSPEGLKYRATRSEKLRCQPLFSLAFLRIFGLWPGYIQSTLTTLRK